MRSSRWFERRGHEVHLARSIEDAKQILAEHEPAAIFLDVWLGKESGFELMGWIEDMRPELADRVTFVTGEIGGLARAPASLLEDAGPTRAAEAVRARQLESHAFGAVDAPGGGRRNVYACRAT